MQCNPKRWKTPLLGLALLLGACQPDQAAHEGPAGATQGDAGSQSDGATSNAHQPLTASAVSASFEVLNPSDPTRPLYHTFGTVEFGQIYVRSLRMRNLERNPVKVLKATAACSCGKIKRITTTDQEGRIVKGDMGRKNDILTIPPGAEFQVDMVVDTSKVKPNQPKLAILRIKTDSTIQPFLTFEVNFFPEVLFEMAAPQITLGEIPLGGGVGSTLQIYSRASLNQARLLEVVETSPGLEADLQLIPGYESNWNLTVQAIGQTSKGFLRGEVVLSTTDRDGQGDTGRLRVPVHGQVVDPIAVYPQNLSFGRVPTGETRTVKAVVKGLAAGHRLQVTGGRLTGPSAPYLSLRLEPIAPDEFDRAVQVEAYLELSSDAPAGPLEATLELDLPEEADGVLARRISGVVGGAR